MNYFYEAYLLLGQVYYSSLQLTIRCLWKCRYDYVSCGVPKHLPNFITSISIRSSVPGTTSHEEPHGVTIVIQIFGCYHQAIPLPIPVKNEVLSIIYFSSSQSSSPQTCQSTSRWYVRLG
jgi:hypothetical protein